MKMNNTVSMIAQIAMIVSLTAAQAMAYVTDEQLTAKAESSEARSYRNDREELQRYRNKTTPVKFAKPNRGKPTGKVNCRGDYVEAQVSKGYDVDGSGSLEGNDEVKDVYTTCILTRVEQRQFTSFSCGQGSTEAWYGEDLNDNQKIESHEFTPIKGSKVCMAWDSHLSEKDIRDMKRAAYWGGKVN